MKVNEPINFGHQNFRNEIKLNMQTEPSLTLPGKSLQCKVY